MLSWLYIIQMYIIIYQCMAYVNYDPLWTSYIFSIENNDRQLPIPNWLLLTMSDKFK